MEGGGTEPRWVGCDGVKLALLHQHGPFCIHFPVLITSLAAGKSALKFVFCFLFSFSFFFFFACFVYSSPSSFSFFFFSLLPLLFLPMLEIK